MLSVTRRGYLLDIDTKTHAVRRSLQVFDNASARFTPCIPGQFNKSATVASKAVDLEWR